MSHAVGISFVVELMDVKRQKWIRVVLKCLSLIGTENYYQQLKQVFDFFLSWRRQTNKLMKN